MSAAKANRELVWQVVDGEAMIVDVASGEYFSLNPVATSVWTALHSGQTVAAVIDAIAAGYHVERSTVERDVRELVGEIEEIGLWTA